MTSAAAADQPNSCQMDVLVKETTEMLYVNRNLVRVRMRCGRVSVGVCCRTTEVGWTRHVFVFPVKALVSSTDGETRGRRCSYIVIERHGEADVGGAMECTRVRCEGEGRGAVDKKERERKARQQSSSQPQSHKRKKKIL